MTQPRPRLCGLLLPIAWLLFSGCTSIKTTQLFRSASGKFSGHCVSFGTKGVPCKLKVETGILVRINETYFVDPNTGMSVPSHNRIYDVATHPVYSDQVFMVHIPRPFAGTLDLWASQKGYQFKDGYLTSIGASMDDRTVEDLTSILGPNNLGGLLRRTDATTTVDKSSLEACVRTVAVREFSFANPNWHLEMNAWVNQFQPCHALCPSPCLDSPCLDPTGLVDQPTETPSDSPSAEFQPHGQLGSALT